LNIALHVPQRQAHPIAQPLHPPGSFDGVDSPGVFPIKFVVVVAVVALVAFVALCYPLHQRDDDRHQKYFLDKKKHISYTFSFKRSDEEKSVKSIILKLRLVAAIGVLGLSVVFGR
jgi:hypothetical protein